MTALDYFVTLNFAFIFATIVQFAIVHYFTKIGSGEYYIPPPEILKRLEVARKEAADKDKDDTKHNQCNENEEGIENVVDDVATERHESNRDMRTTRHVSDLRQVTNERLTDDEETTERDFGNKALMGNHVSLQNASTSSQRLAINVSGGFDVRGDLSKQQVTVYPSSKATHSLSLLMKSLDDDTRKEMTFQPSSHGQQTSGYLSERFSSTDKVEVGSSSRSRRLHRESHRQDAEATKSACPKRQHQLHHMSTSETKSPSLSSSVVRPQQPSNSLMEGSSEKKNKILVDQIPQTSSSMEEDGETFRDYCPIHVSVLNKWTFSLKLEKRQTDLFFGSQKLHFFLILSKQVNSLFFSRKRGFLEDVSWDAPLLLSMSLFFSICFYTILRIHLYIICISLCLSPIKLQANFLLCNSNFGQKHLQKKYAWIVSFSLKSPFSLSHVLVYQRPTCVLLVTS